MYTHNKKLEDLFRSHKEDYEKIFKNFWISFLAGKLDGDGNVNISRGILEIYYVSKGSLKQIEKDFRILQELKLNPTIRRHKNGKALVIGSRKNDSELVVELSKKLIPNIKLLHT